MLTKLRMAAQIARYVLLAIATVRQLVIDAEEAFAGQGRGAEKFAAVLAGLRAAASYIGIASEAIDAAERFAADRIEDAVSTEVNNE